MVTNRLNSVKPRELSKRPIDKVVIKINCRRSESWSKQSGKCQYFPLQRMTKTVRSCGKSFFFPLKNVSCFNWIKHFYILCTTLLNANFASQFPWTSGTGSWCKYLVLSLLFQMLYLSSYLETYFGLHWLYKITLFRLSGYL